MSGRILDNLDNQYIGQAPAERQSDTARTPADIWIVWVVQKLARRPPDVCDALPDIVRPVRIGRHPAGYRMGIAGTQADIGRVPSGQRPINGPRIRPNFQVGQPIVGRDTFNCDCNRLSFADLYTPADALKSHTPPGLRFNCDWGIN